jgi:hypothetical protein
LQGQLRPVDAPLAPDFTVDVAPDAQSPGLYQVTGPDPYWVYRLPRPLPPAEVGLLGFTITCRGSDERPVVQVFWRASSGAFSEGASLWFEASFERNLVPLDSTVAFSLLPDIAEVRVDVASPGACPEVELTDVTLFRRSSPLAATGPASKQ